MFILILPACTIYVRPIAKPKTRTEPTVTHVVQHKDKKKESVTLIVDAMWVDRYYKLEHEHGNSTIPADSGITPEGDKFKVPKPVVEHFHDMQHAWLPSPSPSPTPRFDPLLNPTP